VSKIIWPKKFAPLMKTLAQRRRNVVDLTIDARNDAHLWAEHYDRDFADIFAIQSDVAEQIADQLRAKLSRAEKAAITERPTSIKAAGEKDWRALAEWLKLTFPEHRPGHSINVSINVSATANAQQAVVITGEHRKQLQEKLRRYQEYQDSPERAKTKQPANG
jgi:hypothetical protein